MTSSTVTIRNLYKRNRLNKKKTSVIFHYLFYLQCFLLLTNKYILFLILQTLSVISKLLREQLSSCLIASFNKYLFTLFPVISQCVLMFLIPQVFYWPLQKAVISLLLKLNPVLSFNHFLAFDCENVSIYI